MAALAAGMRVRDRIDAQTYRAWLRKALWVMVVLLLLQFSRSVFAREPLFGAIAQHRSPPRWSWSRKATCKPGMRTATPPLHRAVETGMRRLVQSLLAAGADPQARTSNGETALAPRGAASRAGVRRPAARRESRSAGAERRRRIALHWAAFSGHIVVAQRLLARGADARQAHEKGVSARDYARREGHAEIARLLERADQ